MYIWKTAIEYVYISKSSNDNVWCFGNANNAVYEKYSSNKELQYTTLERPLILRVIGHRSTWLGGCNYRSAIL